MLNSAIIIGRLTRDPELSRTQNDIAVCNFTIACERNFANADDKKEVDFINVVVWRGLAETCGKYLAKGKLVAVEGRLQMRSYEAKDGTKRTVSEINADNVQFLSPKSEGTAPEQEPMGEEMIAPEDIPF